MHRRAFVYVRLRTNATTAKKLICSRLEHNQQLCLLSVNKHNGSLDNYALDVPFISLIFDTANCRAKTNEKGGDGRSVSHYA